MIKNEALHLVFWEIGSRFSPSGLQAQVFAQKHHLVYRFYENKFEVNELNAYNGRFHLSNGNSLGLA